MAQEGNQHRARPGSIVVACALLLAACGGGGGGGGSGEATATSAFSEGTVASAEPGASIPIEIVLRVPWGELEDAVEFSIFDAGTGSAISGADYQPLGALTVTFPAGAVDGATQTITWTPIDDGTSEGNETVHLRLAGVTESVAHVTADVVVTILDDESATLAVARGSVDGRLIPSGETLTLAPAPVDAPGGSTIDVWLDNIGVAALRVSTPVLTSGSTREFKLETPVQMGATAFRAGPPTELAFPLLAPGAATAGAASAVPVVLSPELLAELTTSDNVILRGAPVPGGLPLDLALERVPNPIRPGAALEIDGRRVAGGLEGFAADVSLWSGHVVGDESARVFLGLSSDGSRGWIRTGSRASDTLHLVTGATGGGSPVSTLVWGEALAPAASDAPAPAACSGVLEVPGREVGLLTAPALQNGDSHTPYVCRLAIETDYQLYAKFGDPTALATYVTELVGAVSDRFQNDVGTSFQIAYLGIHTTPEDPWSVPDGGGGTMDLLNEFQQAWAPVYGGAWPVEADLAHFLSGAYVGGGMAYVNVIGSDDYGFGVSTGLDGIVDWSAYTGGGSTLYWDFDVLAHELGHAFNARHTHEYCPPLDTCALSCQGQFCERGTIMSYCHACAGGVGNVDLVFHPLIANVMRQAANASALAEDELAPGTSTFFRVTFEPTGAPGRRTATLQFTHDATSAPSPYTIKLVGEALEPPPPSSGLSMPLATSGG